MNDFIPSINTSLLVAANITEKLIISALNAFRMVEVNYEDIRHDAAMGARSLQDLQMDAVSVTQLMGWFESDGGLMGTPDDHEAIMDECKRRIERAAEFGATSITALPAYEHRGYFAELSEGADHYYELSNIGKEFGVEVVLSVLGESTQINSVESALDFLNMIGDPSSKIVVDCYEIWRGGGTPEDLRLLNPWRISHLRIADSTTGLDRKKHGDRHRTVPGKGVIANSGFFKIAEEIGFEGPVVVDPRIFPRSVHESAEMLAELMAVFKRIQYGA